MVSIRRILCPTDFSDYSRRAFQHAIHLARWRRCEVVALHVNEPAQAPPWSRWAHPVAGEEAEARRHASEKLEEFVAQARPAGVKVRPVVGEGRDVEEILNQVRAQAADLLVMGTHGRGGFERFLLGSVAEKVLRRADCPVIVVPSPHADSGEEPLPRRGTVPYHHILCPIDFSATSMAALRHAVDLANEASRGSKVRLTILHCLEFAMDEPREMRHFSVPEFHRFLAEDAVRRMLSVFPATTRKRLGVDAVVVTGKAHTRIVSLAEELLADLIIMGVSGHAAPDRALFGSTAQHVTRGADCPVLTIHED
jgi:nucleotide-binding universal stress UspA family protein